MISLKLKYFDGTSSEEIITPTIFNDGTSQVWKLEKIKSNYTGVLETQIVWLFENEAEIVHVAQLSDLLSAYKILPIPLKTLYIPFLPYGRQDKQVHNVATFAQHTFSKLIDAMGFDRVSSFDVHGASGMKNLQRISANSLIQKLFDEKKYDLFCYPDGGACLRYHHEPSINAIKERDQNTGDIVDYYLQYEYKNAKGEYVDVEVEGKKILVVDDLCDQGGTFLRLIQMIKERNPLEVNLYVSHMVGGDDVVKKLKDAGYANVYYTNSLLKNVEGIKIV